MAFYRGLKGYDNDPEYPGKQGWVADRLLALRGELATAIKDDRASNSLIIGSWNIRAFDEGKPRMDESGNRDIPFGFPPTTMPSVDAPIKHTAPPAARRMVDAVCSKRAIGRPARREA